MERAPDSHIERLNDRRADERREDVPDSVKPFLGWLIPEERRKNDRRAKERRES